MDTNKEFKKMMDDMFRKATLQIRKDKIKKTDKSTKGSDNYVSNR